MKQKIFKIGIEGECDSISCVIEIKAQTFEEAKEKYLNQIKEQLKEA